MKSQSFTTAFTVDKTPAEAFAAINNVRGWWSGNIEGSTDKLGEEWIYRYEDVHYSKQKITELVPKQENRLGCPRQLPEFCQGQDRVEWLKSCF